jgi:hypothetical protein
MIRRGSASRPSSPRNADDHVGALTARPGRRPNPRIDWHKVGVISASERAAAGRPFSFTTCDGRHGAKDTASICRRTTGLAELYGANAPMVLPLEVSIMLEQDEGKAHASWRDCQPMLCGIHHTPQAKPKRVERGRKIAPREVVTAAAQAFARNEIDRAELMRRITPSPSPMKSQAPARSV